MLKFRNLNVTPEDPVDTWGVEGLLTAIERGGAVDWAKITHADTVFSVLGSPQQVSGSFSVTSMSTFL